MQGLVGICAEQNQHVTLHVQNNIGEDEPKYEYELKSKNNLRNDAPKMKKPPKKKNFWWSRKYS